VDVYTFCKAHNAVATAERSIGNKQIYIIGNIVNDLDKFY